MHLSVLKPWKAGILAHRFKPHNCPMKSRESESPCGGAVLEHWLNYTESSQTYPNMSQIPSLVQSDPHTQYSETPSPQPTSNKGRGKNALRGVLALGFSGFRFYGTGREFLKQAWDPSCIQAPFPCSRANPYIHRGLHTGPYKPLNPNPRSHKHPGAYILRP